MLRMTSHVTTDERDRRFWNVTAMHVDVMEGRRTGRHVSTLSHMLMSTMKTTLYFMHTHLLYTSTATSSTNYIHKRLKIDPERASGAKAAENRPWSDKRGSGLLSRFARGRLSACEVTLMLLFKYRAEHLLGHR
jgi:hypothetical protein